MKNIFKKLSARRQRTFSLGFRFRISQTEQFISGRILQCRFIKSASKPQFSLLSGMISTKLVAQTVKCLSAMRETWVGSLGREDPLEKEMATHSSTLAWKIPWMEEPGRLWSMGSLRVGHDCSTSLSLSCIGEGNGNPLQCSCLENPWDEGAWQAAVHGVAQSWTRLK